MFKTSAHTIVLSYSGIYNWLYTVGFNSVNEIYNLIIQLELLAVISIPLAKVDSLLNEELLLGLKSYTCITTNISAIPMANGYYHSFGRRLNCHNGILIGFASILWFHHLHYHAIPIARQHAIVNILASLTFFGGLKLNTQSLYLTDTNTHLIKCFVYWTYACLNIVWGIFKYGKVNVSVDIMHSGFVAGCLVGHNNMLVNLVGHNNMLVALIFDTMHMCVGNMLVGLHIQMCVGNMLVGLHI